MMSILYLLGVGVAFMRLVVAAAQTRALLQKATQVSLPALPALCARFGLCRAPRVARLTGFSSPLLAFGTILLPEPALADEALIVAHELAHVKRRDLFWEGLGALVGVLLWFHPLVWWARREEKLAREQAADTLALAVTAAPRAEYARVLLTATLAHTPELAVGAFASPSRLRRRLEALAQPALPRRKATSLLLLACVLALPALIPWRAVARQQAAQGGVGLPRPDSPHPHFGMVRTKADQPLGDVLVRLVQVEVEPLTKKAHATVVAQTHTAPDGTFRFPENLTQASLRVLVDTPGYSPNYAPNEGMFFEPGRGWRITLEPATQWEVTILDKQGRPLSQQPLEVRQWGWGGLARQALEPERFQGTTDAQGTFRTEGLSAPGTMDRQSGQLVRLKDPRLVPVSLQTTKQGSRVFQKMVVIEGRTISGRVRDLQGRPVAGREVVLEQPGLMGTYFPSPSTTTDSQGRFTLVGARPAPCRVRLEVGRQESYAPVRSERLSLESGNLTGVELRLTPGGVVQGTVREKSRNQPLPGAGVRVDIAYSYTDTSQGKPVTRVDFQFAGFTRTDSQGRYTLHVPPGKTVKLSLEGTFSPRFPAPSARVFQGREGETHTIDFSPVSPMPLEGIVVDSTGKPVEGATVQEQHVMGIAATTNARGHFSIPEWQLPMGVYGGWASNDRGKRTKGVLVANDFQLFAQKGVLSGRATVGFNQKAPVRVVLVAGKVITVRGRVVSAFGEPLSGVKIRVMPLNPEPRDRENGLAPESLSLTTDADGRFEGLLHSVGKVMAAIWKEGWSHQSVRGMKVLPLGSTAELGTLQLTKADAVLAGKVVDRQGSPIAGVSLHVFGGAILTQTTKTDAAGRFFVSNIVPGSTLSANLAGMMKGKRVQAYRYRIPANRKDIVFCLDGPDGFSTR
ncbi:protocatechuate 3,4-dioxygenase beta subunit [Armatimonas rosea]|uniref:Protocatechuate 3,4-dioxygenase beta subunit n=2 Tax=Armatimonas rosea TaxID=685828 RepID=A0A7W9STD7_ARMRO|nr:protocatechuate 3,4-dioxygenase beta subunit [Armatimonas rosea]